MGGLSVVAVSVGVMEITGATRDSASCRAAIAAGTAAVADLLTLLWQVQGAELGDVLGELDALAASAGGARVAVVAEAESRGDIAASQAGSTPGWVAAHAPSLAAGSGAGQVARMVRDSARPEMATVRAAAVSGAVSVPVALTVLSEFARLKPRLREDAAPTVLQGLLDMGVADGSRGVRSLRPALLAAHGADGEFQADADTAERLISLSRPSADECGAFTYHLVLDPAGAAALEAAIGPLSAPVPGPDGERDRRSVQLRRGQALVEVCRRATSAGDRPPSGVKTTLMVTMSYADLVARTGAATVLGSAQGGTLIAPETVRRLACDASVIPVVLGGGGEVLELGRATRLATPGQLAALWWRDRSCSFPGCTTPAHWCDAHHLVHWADGGETRIDNLALLCGRHHSVVHRDHLFGRVDSAAVTWDLIPGSYDRHRAGLPPPGDAPAADSQWSDPPPNGRTPPRMDPWADPWTDRDEPTDAPSAGHLSHADHPDHPDRHDRHEAAPEADPWFDSGPAA